MASNVAPPKPINPIAASRNMQAAAFIRTLLAVVVGCAVGIIGLTGTAGFVVYVAQHLIASAVVLQMAKWKPAEYFPQASILGTVLGSIGDNVLAFILFWTLAYALIHIY